MQRYRLRGVRTILVIAGALTMYHLCYPIQELHTPRSGPVGVGSGWFMRVPSHVQTDFGEHPVFRAEISWSRMACQLGLVWATAGVALVLFSVPVEN